MTQLTDIRRCIESELAEYQKRFDACLSHTDPFMDQALSYIRGKKGKMMRPMLVMLIAKERGPVRESTLLSAVALELLHTASLVHDDIVDESEERRGQRSVNAVYDNKIAVLLGDFLLARTLHSAALTGKLEIVETVAALGGTLSEGEIYQLANTQTPDFSEEGYYRVILHKTAALFRDCARLGAISSDSTDDFEASAIRLGEIIGLIFQIRDDIFDYYDDAAIGKPRGNDMAEGKLTLPVLHALNTVHDEHMREVALKVKKRTASSEEIQNLIAFAKRHGGIEYAEQKMQEFQQEALQLLSSFHNAEIRESLTHYIDFVIKRKI